MFQYINKIKYISTKNGDYSIRAKDAGFTLIVRDEENDRVFLAEADDLIKSCQHTTTWQKNKRFGGRAVTSLGEPAKNFIEL